MYADSNLSKCGKLCKISFSSTAVKCFSQLYLLFKLNILLYIFTLVPVWSGVTLCGIHLRDVNTQLGNDRDPEDWKELFKQTIQRYITKNRLCKSNIAYFHFSENEVSKLKKCSSWGISLGVARMVNAILHDTKECFPISTHIKVINGSCNTIKLFAQLLFHVNVHFVFG